MIKNLKCYCNNSCQPTNYYVRFTNNCSLHIRCILQYTSSGQTHTQQIELSKRCTKKFYVPTSAVNVCLNVLNISLPSPKLIYHGCILGLENVCYEIRGTVQNPMCIKTTCFTIFY